MSVRAHDWGRSFVGVCFGRGTRDGNIQQFVCPVFRFVETYALAFLLAFLLALLFCAIKVPGWTFHAPASLSARCPLLKNDKRRFLFATSLSVCLCVCLCVYVLAAPSLGVAIDVINVGVGGSLPALCLKTIRGIFCVLVRVPALRFSRSLF